MDTTDPGTAWSMNAGQLPAPDASGSGLGPTDTNRTSSKLLFHMYGPSALTSKIPSSNEQALGKEVGTVNALELASTTASSPPKSSIQPSLSWQCFSSLLFTGPGSKHMPDGTAGVQPMNLGPFSKASAIPLVLTVPYSAALREKLLKFKYSQMSKSNASDMDVIEDILPASSQDFTPAQRARLVAAQRSLRAKLVHSYVEQRRTEAVRLISGSANGSSYPAHKELVSHPRNDIIKPENYCITEAKESAPPSNVIVNLHPMSGPLSGLLPRWTTGTYRSRKQPRKDVRQFEKDSKRKIYEKEQTIRIRNQIFLKDVLAHRDEFVRFHKAKKVDIARIARSMKAYVENEDARKEKEEAKAEERRLRALKENDMVAYNQLVQETKNERLKHLLNQTDGYMQTINQLIENQRADGASASKAFGAKPALGSPEEEQSNSKGLDDLNSVGVVSERSSSVSAIEGTSAQRYFETTHKLSEQVIQPSLLKGGDLKEYQLLGLQWMVSLYNNNLNGILADEMGLGKTIQAIALLGYLMEYKHNHGPFLIVVPLSTLSNWSNEISKWVPDMMKVVYKGTPPIRKQIYRDDIEGGHFNILLTTYEYVMKDKTMLKKLAWEYIIVDEGHRMKNAQSKFAQILGNHYVSRHRILLTGTPLQNNLPELWALLNFLLPSIFNSVETFDQWFNKPFSTFRQSQQVEGNEDVVSLNQEERLLIVQRLHELLRPFMLRRVKDQVLDQLPEKTEIVLRCELSGWQRYLYRTIQQRCVGTIKGNTMASMKSEAPKPDADIGLSSGVSAASLSSLQANDDDEFDEDTPLGKSVMFASEDVSGSGELASSASGTAGLNNVIMQLRKVCNHPYLFMQDWPIDDDMVRTSGKFELLDRMLPKLKAAGHRVLMFSQMTQLMTILEKFFELKKFPYLRLDGSTMSDDREKRMYQFNDPNSPYFIFLLSTRAGGLGLNLATADTVFLFDSDWNPMMDAQAQDRAHRIGQKNEVRVFRLISTSPVEERILARATDKLNLTELVVEAGKFNKSGNDKGSDSQARKEMVEALLAEYSESREQCIAEDTEAGVITSESVVQDEDTLNAMMSLHDSELALYQKMDAEKAEQTARFWAMSPGGKAGLPIPPRLMPSDSLPQWIIDGHCWGNKYMKMFGPAVIEGDIVEPEGLYDTTASGRKRRLDGIVGSYSENMSDAQFDVFIGERKGKGTPSGNAASNPRSISTKGRGGRGGINAPSAASRKPSNSASRGRGRGRSGRGGPGRGAPTTGNAGGSTGAGRGRGVRVRPGVIPMDITSDLIRISLVLRKIERADGSLLSFLFIDLPDAKHYPDYYEIIKNPISLKLITKKLRDAQYRTVSEITYDHDLLAANAALYNGPESPVTKDAVYVVSEWKRLIGALSIPDHLLVPVDTSTLPTFSTMLQLSEDGHDEDGDDNDEGNDEGNDDSSNGAALEDHMNPPDTDVMELDIMSEHSEGEETRPAKRLKPSLPMTGIGQTLSDVEAPGCGDRVTVDA